MVPAYKSDCTNCLRFESVNYPGKFLRHANYEIVLTELSSDADFQDATFRPSNGLVGAGVSYESYNYPGYYIRHAYSRLWVSSNTGDELFKNDASFTCVMPLYKPQVAAPAAKDFSAIRSDEAIIDERTPDYYVRIKICNRNWAGTDGTVSVRVQDATNWKSKWIVLDEAGDDFTVDSNYAYKVDFGGKLVYPVKLWVWLDGGVTDSMCLEGVGLSTNPDSPYFQQMSENNDFWLDIGSGTVAIEF